MPHCHFVTKISTPRDPTFQRCAAARAPKSLYCEKHDKLVRENPAIEAQQRPFRKSKSS